jgi:hypothetical protein
MGGVRVGSVVIDCNDFDRMFAFWRDALGYSRVTSQRTTGSCCTTPRVRT